MAIIEVNHVTKEFKLGALHGFRQTLQNSLARLRGQPTQERPLFKALDDINFKVEPGEVLGIIGHNGAGKSTLLKLLANITSPTHGSVNVKGKVAPLIEVGAGLVGDLTGRENIFLNGAILGIPKAEIRRKFDEIVAFAELEEFIDTPIKRYSSGMAVRLGFAIATSVDSDILIVDEVLAVGDLAFQRKCFDRMEAMIKNEDKTVLLVSHNIRQVQRMCTRVMLLNQGKIEALGEPHKVCDLFYAKSDEKILEDAGTGHNRKNIFNSGELDLLSLRILNAKDSSISYQDDIIVVFKIKINTALKNLKFGLGIHTTDFIYLSTHNSEQQLNINKLQPGVHEIACHILKLPLLPGVYSLRAGITAGEISAKIFYGENLLHFNVLAPESGHLPASMREGFFVLNANWNVKLNTLEPVRQEY